MASLAKRASSPARPSAKGLGFWSILRKEMRSGGGREELADLEGAAEFLYDDSRQACRRLRLGRMTTRRQGVLLRQFKAEIDQKTAGQPFRLETQGGPLFVLLPLWRYAGCSGPYMGPGNGAKTKDRPTWDGNWRRSA
jgi:hypothetical protein